MTIIEEGWLETLLHVLQNIYYKLFLSEKKDLFKKKIILVLIGIKNIQIIIH